MAKYKIVIEGTGIVFNDGDNDLACGFFATRVISSESIDSIKKVIYDKLLNELKNTPAVNCNDLDIIKIEMVEENTEETEDSYEGFSFYPVKKKFIEKVLGLFGSK